jgi:hypothetical protein
MQTPRASRLFFFIYSSFVAVSAILILAGVLVSPSEPGNAILLGLSLPRLVLALGLLIASLFFVFLSVKAVRDPAWGDRWLENSDVRRVITWFAGLSFALGWIGCFLPFYRAGALSVHWERMRPAMMFFLLAGIATLVFILFRRSNFRLSELRRSNIFKASLVLFLLSILLIGLMLSTGFGVYAPEDYWYGAGVPIWSHN